MYELKWSRDFWLKKSLQTLIKKKNRDSLESEIVYHIHPQIEWSNAPHLSLN